MADSRFFDAVIFDFDGVLVNSGLDICNAINHTLELNNVQRLPNEKIIDFVGFGARKLLRLCFGESKSATVDIDKDIEFIYSQYFEYYMAHSTDQSTMYPGVAETLRSLNVLGVPCAVVTNKPESLTRRICEIFEIDKYFKKIIGPESVGKAKPDPEGINLFLKECVQGTKTQTPYAVMVGDTDIDIFAGRSAGIHTCGVTYGLGDFENLKAAKPDFFIDEFSKIMELGVGAR